MNAVYCFSATGRSLEAARFFADRLGIPVTETGKGSGDAETAVVIFPVYCQNIPEPVKEFLPRLNANHVALIACYGRMHHGNVLMEAEKLVSGQVIAAAYVPIGHTYLDEPAGVDTAALLPILSRIYDPKRARLKREFKNPLADFVPSLRSQLGVKIERNDRCTGCDICVQNCPMSDMRRGIPGNSCIRCLRCVHICPERALAVSYAWPLRLYLRKKKKNKTILYL